MIRITGARRPRATDGPPSRDSRAARALLALLGATAMSIVPAAAFPVGAQNVLITTPYPSVSVQPGATATFDLAVRADAPVRVDFSFEGVPDGWDATLRGGGREVSSAFADPDQPPELTLDLEVPEDAEAGEVSVSLIGRAGAETARLSLDVAVVTAEDGSVLLTTDVPARSGAADDAFEYTVDLENDTPQQLTFELQAVGPRGWTISVAPTGEEGATSVTVDARGSQSLTVSATPPAQATEGDYPIQVRALAGERSAAADLLARVTGRVALEFTTVDQRLNATATAGSSADVEVVILNTGTASLSTIGLGGSGPSEWEVTFDPQEIAAIAPGDTGTATARITPSENAVAGDYVVELSATGEGVDESIEIRVTVETSPVWGAVGIALIVLTLAGMVWVFRRYGRR